MAKTIVAATTTKRPGKSAKVKTAPPAKIKASDVKRSEPKHPSTSAMVLEAIETLREKNGSSLQSIKKYLIDNYNVDMDGRMGTFVKKFLRSGVQNGELIQTSGKGAAGSFKLPGQAKPTGTKSRGGGQNASPAAAAPKPKVKKVKKLAEPKPTKPRTKRGAAAAAVATADSSSSSPEPEDDQESAKTKTPPARQEKPLVAPSTPKKKDPSAATSEESAAEEEAENKKPAAKKKSPAAKGGRKGRGKKPAAAKK